MEFGGDTRFVAVASPAYLAAHPAPQTLDALKTHACIRFPLPSGKLFRWEFEKHGHELAVDVPGVRTLDHVALMAQAAAKGLGIAYVSDRTARLSSKAARSSRCLTTGVLGFRAFVSIIPATVTCRRVCRPSSRC